MTESPVAAPDPTAVGPDGTRYLIDEVRQPYLAENERLGAQGLRVMATARRDFDAGTFDPSVDLLIVVGASIIVVAEVRKLLRRRAIAVQPSGTQPTLTAPAS